MFLAKVEAAVSVAQIETVIKQILAKFFSAVDLPMPKIKIVNNLTSKWLGRCTYTQATKNVIEIQKKIVNDDKTLHRVLCHELIHAVTFYALFEHPEQGSENWKRRKYYDGHGKDFHDWAAKINSVMGKDYVTEKSDESYVLSLDKDYFLLIIPTKNYGGTGDLGWVWCARPTDDMKKVIQQRIQRDGAKLFKSRDEYFTNGAKVKKYGPISIPKGKDVQQKLQDLYKNGKEFKMDFPKTLSLEDIHKKVPVGDMMSHLDSILKNDPLGVLK